MIHLYLFMLLLAVYFFVLFLLRLQRPDPLQLNTPLLTFIRFLGENVSLHPDFYDRPKTRGLIYSALDNYRYHYSIPDYRREEFYTIALAALTDGEAVSLSQKETIK